ncbi:hypothetical protein [Salinispora arenicola]|uniref:hypothetical protein n=1 Tax=Salinispora arenicola TaxID=168697 RepID=UPI0016914A75|nr:hypothetical protein [Salinispora arenicola]NIL64990.1 hypothetical protein [Salinispora arenicola]
MINIEVVSWREVPVTLGSDGLYHAKVTVGKRANGALDRRHRSGKTEVAVRSKLRKLLKEVDAGRKPRVGRVPTVEDWFTTWLTDIAPYGAKALARRSLDDYWSRCQNWIFPHLGGILVDALETEDLDRLYKAMYSKKPPCSEGHVLKTHAVIRRGLEIALRRGRVTRNVAKLMDPPGAPRAGRPSLSRNDARAVLDVARQRRNGARWFLGLAIGPRQGETLGLRWPDLDLDNEVVTIQWQLHRLPGDMAATTHTLAAPDHVPRTHGAYTDSSPALPDALATRANAAARRHAHATVRSTPQPAPCARTADSSLPGRRAGVVARTLALSRCRRGWPSSTRSPAVSEGGDAGSRYVVESK